VSFKTVSKNRVVESSVRKFPTHGYLIVAILTCGIHASQLGLAVVFAAATLAFRNIFQFFLCLIDNIARDGGTGIKLSPVEKLKHTIRREVLVADTEISTTP
jgi:hypothetical protein